VSGNDWIHTLRGVTLVEDTLPKLARAIESAAKELKRSNDRADGVPSEAAVAKAEEAFWQGAAHSASTLLAEAMGLANTDVPERDLPTMAATAAAWLGKFVSDQQVVVECMVRVTDKAATPYGWVGQVKQTDWRTLEDGTDRQTMHWLVDFILPEGEAHSDWYEPHQIERLHLVAAEQHIFNLLEDRRVEALLPKAKQLTYEEGCLCPTCVMRRESEAIANEPDGPSDRVARIAKDAMERTLDAVCGDPRGWRDDDPGVWRALFDDAEAVGIDPWAYWQTNATSFEYGRLAEMVTSHIHGGLEDLPTPENLLSAPPYEEDPRR